MHADRNVQANALRELARYIEEEDGEDLPEQVASAVASIVDLIKVDQAVEDWWDREAKGEKTIPSAEVRKILGLCPVPF